MARGAALSFKRALPGYGAKGLFHGVLVPHFRKNAARLATSVLGSACEQWLNAECFQAIVAHRPDVWVWPEYTKRDLVLLAPDTQPPKPVLVIESKVLYGHEARGKQETKLSTLAGQLERASRATGAPALGLVVFCRFRWREERGDWDVKSWAAPRLSRRERTARGLENAFQQASKSVDVQTVRMRRFTYEVEVSFEMLRLAGPPRRSTARG
jgi:hypothetical protein